MMAASTDFRLARAYPPSEGLQNWSNDSRTKHCVVVNGSVWGVLIKLARCALCVGRRGRASSFKAGQSELASYRGGAARENHDFRGNHKDKQLDGTRVAVDLLL